MDIYTCQNLLNCTLLFYSNLYFNKIYVTVFEDILGDLNILGALKRAASLKQPKILAFKVVGQHPKHRLAHV